MKDRFEWIQNELSKIHEKQTEMVIVLTENTVSLKEHMRRTALLEEEIKRMESDLKPIKFHVHLVTLMSKILLSSGIYKLISWIISLHIL